MKREVIDCTTGRKKSATVKAAELAAMQAADAEAENAAAAGPSDEELVEILLRKEALARVKAMTAEEKQALRESAASQR